LAQPVESMGVLPKSTSSKRKVSVSRKGAAAAKRARRIPISVNGEASLVAAIEASLAKAKADQIVHVPFGADDVGGEMVAITSEGLYADPRDALREYVQNSVDAGAEDIIVVLGASSVKVEDNGGGMSLDLLLRARQFAKSSKSALSSVGFRGIGIYAGFPMCDRLRIETQQARATVRHTLTFDFKWMRERLLAERKARPGSERTSLPVLMTEGTSIAAAVVKPSSRGKTIVHLEGLSDHAVSELADFELLRQYLVQTLPVGYSDFNGKDEVVEFLRSNVPGYRTVNVTLKNTVTKANEAVTREYPSRLGSPIFLKADDSGTKHKAVIWAALTGTKDVKHFAKGLLYKSRGFTIGDQDRTRRLFTRRKAVVEWIFGEIWVIDPAVTPNAARNDFEATQPKRDLDAALVKPIKALTDIAVFNQAITRAKTVYDNIEQDLPDIEKAARRPNTATFSEARYKFYEARRSFTGQKFKETVPQYPGLTADSSKRIRTEFKVAATALDARRSKLEKRISSLRVLFDPPTPAADQSANEGSSGSEGSHDTSKTSDTGATSQTQAKHSDSQETSTATTGASSGGAGAGKTDSTVTTPSQLTLLGIVTDAGLAPTRALQRAFEALTAALNEALRPLDREAVLTAFQRRLRGR
jgi:hypothetical protein